MSDLTQEQIDSDVIAYYSEPNMVQTLESCWGLGPLSVCARMVPVGQIEVSIKLAGIKIGSGTISAKNNKICASANVGLVKASVCVRADFPNSTVWVEGKICRRKLDLSWNCDPFKTKLISW